MDWVTYNRIATLDLADIVRAQGNRRKKSH